MSLTPPSGEQIVEDIWDLLTEEMMAGATQGEVLELLHQLTDSNDAYGALEYDAYDTNSLYSRVRSHFGHSNFYEYLASEGFDDDIIQGVLEENEGAYPTSFSPEELTTSYDELVEDYLYRNYDFEPLRQQLQREISHTDVTLEDMVDTPEDLDPTIRNILGDQPRLVQEQLANYIVANPSGLPLPDTPPPGTLQGYSDQTVNTFWDSGGMPAEDRPIYDHSDGSRQSYGIERESYVGPSPDVLIENAQQRQTNRARHWDDLAEDMGFLPEPPAGGVAGVDYQPEDISPFHRPVQNVYPPKTAWAMLHDRVKDGPGTPIETVASGLSQSYYVPGDSTTGRHDRSSTSRDIIAEDVRRELAPYEGRGDFIEPHNYSDQTNRSSAAIGRELGYRDLRRHQIKAQVDAGTVPQSVLDDFDARGRTAENQFFDNTFNEIEDMIDRRPRRPDRFRPRPPDQGAPNSHITDADRSLANVDSVLAEANQMQAESRRLLGIDDAIAGDPTYRSGPTGPSGPTGTPGPIGAGMIPEVLTEAEYQAIVDEQYPDPDDIRHQARLDRMTPQEYARFLYYQAGLEHMPEDIVQNNIDRSIASGRLTPEWGEKLWAFRNRANATNVSSVEQPPRPPRQLEAFNQDTSPGGSSLSAATNQWLGTEDFSPNHYLYDEAHPLSVALNDRLGDGPGNMHYVDANQFEGHPGRPRQTTPGGSSMPMDLDTFTDIYTNQYGANFGQHQEGTIEYAHRVFEGQQPNYSHLSPEEQVGSWLSDRWAQADPNERASSFYLARHPDLRDTESLFPNLPSIHDNTGITQERLRRGGIVANEHGFIPNPFDNPDNYIVGSLRGEYSMNPIASFSPEEIRQRVEGEGFGTPREGQQFAFRASSAEYSDPIPGSFFTTDPEVTVGYSAGGGSSRASNDPSDRRIYQFELPENVLPGQEMPTTTPSNYDPNQQRLFSSRPPPPVPPNMSPAPSLPPWRQQAQTAKQTVKSATQATGAAVKTGAKAAGKGLVRTLPFAAGAYAGYDVGSRVGGKWPWEDPKAWAKAVGDVAVEEVTWPFALTELATGAIGHKEETPAQHTQYFDPGAADHMSEAEKAYWYGRKRDMGSVGYHQLKQAANVMRGWGEHGVRSDGRR